MASTIPLFNIIQGMTPWELKLYATKGGRTATDQFVSDFLFATGGAVGDDFFNSLANEVAEQMASISHPTTRYLRAVMGPVPPRGHSKGSKQNFMSVSFDHVGTRIAANGAKGCAIDICATFDKTASYGTKGQMKFRGIFDESEIQTNAAYYPELTPGFNTSIFDNFGATLDGTFNSHNCGLILPAVRGKDWNSNMRPITAFSFVGVSQKQRRNHSRSLRQLEADIFTREIKNLERQAARVLAGIGGVDVQAASRLILPEVEALVKEFTAGRIAAALPEAAEGATVIAECLALAAVA